MHTWWKHMEGVCVQQLHRQIFTEKKRPHISLFLSVYRHTECLWVCAYVYVGGREGNYRYPMLFACFHTHRSTKVCLMGLETYTDTRTLDVGINISMNPTKSPKQTRITYICLNFYLPYSKLRTKQYHISLFQTWFTITNFHLRKFIPLGRHFGKSSGSYFCL